MNKEEKERQRIIAIIEKIQIEEEEKKFGTNLNWDDGFVTAINLILKKIIIIK